MSAKGNRPEIVGQRCVSCVYLSKGKKSCHTQYQRMSQPGGAMLKSLHCRHFVLFLLPTFHICQHIPYSGRPGLELHGMRKDAGGCFPMPLARTSMELFD